VVAPAIEKKSPLTRFVGRWPPVSTRRSSWKPAAALR
jgi:hypothetical protein